MKAVMDFYSTGKTGCACSQQSLLSWLEETIEQLLGDPSQVQLPVDARMFYYGFFSVDGQTVTHHIRGSNNDALIGTDQAREAKYTPGTESSQSRLKLTARNDDDSYNMIAWELIG